MSAVITFRVHGEPKGQPRPRAFARKMGDRFVARVFDSGTAEQWKSLIAAEAKAHIPAMPLVGPVAVDASFIFSRPNKHFVANNPSRPLRADAPEWHTTKPDRDNLEKALLDALTQLGGFWHDDCQVCAGEVRKAYGSHPGVYLQIRSLEKEAA